MQTREKAKAIVQKMYDNDAMSQWLGIDILDVSPGTCKLQMTVRPEMLNGFEIAHGGITYALADTALAFASNGHGHKAVSIETSIAHLKPVVAEDILTTEVEEKSLQNRIALYEVRIMNQKQELVALFRGTVYRKKETWDI